MSEALQLRPQATFADVVAGNVRAEAARLGIEQQQLARALAMSQAAVSDRFRCKTPWSLNEIEAVARVLGTTTSTLLRTSGEEVSQLPRLDSNQQPSD